jgi:hypothetical protein
MHALALEKIVAGDLADLVATAALTLTDQPEVNRCQLNLPGTLAEG